MATYHETSEIKFTARWDRDENGVFADVEVTDYPDYMSVDTIRAVERDIARSMYQARNARLKAVGGAV